MVLQVHADIEHSGIGGRHPTNHRFASVKPQVGHVTSQRMPDEIFTATAEGTEADPAPLDTQRRRLREREIRTEKHLVPK